MASVRALAMFAVALCFMLAANAAAVDGSSEDGALGRRMLGNRGRGLLSGSEFNCEAGFVAMDGICVRDVSSTGEGTPAGSAPAQCGAGGQRVCKGAELDGRESRYECDYGFTGLDGMCVPYVEKEEAAATPAPTPTPAAATATPAATPVATPAPVPTPQPQPTTPGVVGPACDTVPGMTQDWCDSAPDQCSEQLCVNVGKQSGGCSDPMVQAMIAADNSARAAAGAAPLTCDEALCSQALEQSRGMCQRRIMDHHGLYKDLYPGGRGERILGQGFKQLAENTFFNMNPLGMQVEESHKGLMASQYHRENLLNPQMSAVGHAYYVCANGPTQEQVPRSSGQPLVFTDTGPYNEPVMYHTTTFAGTEQPTR